MCSTSLVKKKVFCKSENSKNFIKSWILRVLGIVFSEIVTVLVDVSSSERTMQVVGISMSKISAMLGNARKLININKTIMFPKNFT